MMIMMICFDGHLYSVCADNWSVERQVSRWLCQLPTDNV